MLWTDFWCEQGDFGKEVNSTGYNSFTANLLKPCLSSNVFYGNIAVAVNNGDGWSNIDCNLVSSTQIKFSMWNVINSTTGYHHWYFCSYSK